MPEDPIDLENLDTERMSDAVEPPPLPEEELPLPLQIAEEEPPPLPKPVEPETPSYYSGSDSWTPASDPFDVAPEPAPAPLPSSVPPSPSYSGASGASFDTATGASTPSSSNNKTMIIIVVIALVLILCCCCLVVGSILWTYGDQILRELDLNRVMGGLQLLGLL
ncbi:MAG: hypothetical protein JXA21_05430 [Anaerolineae bacterium]|nr:hypothetical protein [Anaerolineae bacterium]